MKKKILLVSILILLLSASLGWGRAWDNLMYCISSGEQTADATVYTGACFVVGVLVITDGSNDATLIVYDNTASSGTKIWECVVNGADDYGGGMLPYPIYCSTGIRGDVGGTGASYIIFYRKIHSTLLEPIP